MGKRALPDGVVLRRAGIVSDTKPHTGIVMFAGTPHELRNTFLMVAPHLRSGLGKWLVENIDLAVAWFCDEWDTRRYFYDRWIGEALNECGGDGLGTAPLSDERGSDWRERYSESNWACLPHETTMPSWRWGAEFSEHCAEQRNMWPKERDDDTR